MWVSYGKTESADDLQPIIWSHQPSDSEVDAIYREQMPEEFAVQHRTVEAKANPEMVLVKREMFTQTVMRIAELEEEVERLKTEGSALCNRLSAENTAIEIRGFNERKEAADELARLRAENERLQEIITDGGVIPGFVSEKELADDPRHRRNLFDAGLARRPKPGRSFHRERNAMTETDSAATGAGDEPLAWLYNHAKHAPRITPYKQLDHEGWTETALVDAAAIAALRQQLAAMREDRDAHQRDAIRAHEQNAKMAAALREIDSIVNAQGRVVSAILHIQNIVQAALPLAAQGEAPTITTGPATSTHCTLENAGYAPASPSPGLGDLIRKAAESEGNHRAAASTAAKGPT